MNQPLVFENGVHDISNDDYHSSSGISRSALWKFKRSPLHYWDSYLNPDRLPSEDTPALIMGNLIHTVVLEPDLFEKRYIVAPEINRRTKLGKQEWDDFLNAAGDRTVITQEQNDKAFEIAARCVSNAYFRSLIQGTEIERSIYFTHPATGIQCKVRPDSWINAVVTDLKTTADASYKGFQSSAVKYGYFLQAGMINYALKSIGITLEAFAFAVVETAEPYLTEVYALDDEAILYGTEIFDNIMFSFSVYKDKYSDSNPEIPWSSGDVKILQVPRWAEYYEDL